MLLIPRIINYVRNLVFKETATLLIVSHLNINVKTKKMYREEILPISHNIKQVLLMYINCSKIINILSGSIKIMFQIQRKVKILWSPNFAYAIGLIVSDGNLSKDKRHISFKSAEKEMIENFKDALKLNNKISKSARGGEKTKKYLNVYFGDVVFYAFLNKIGISSVKSKTIKSVKVPNKFFADFLRGLFDGDGTFYTFWDTRWSNSFGFQIAFTSASFSFMRWLKNKLAKNYGVKGFICEGKRVFNLRYVKRDSEKIFNIMYCEKDTSLFLKRKYFKIKMALDKNKKLKHNRIR